MNSWAQYTPCRIVAPLLVLCACLVASACVTTIDNAPQVDKARAAQTYIKTGFAYLRKNQRDSARYHFQKAFELQRNVAGAHDGMAMLYQMEGEAELAEKHFRQALKSDKRFSQAYNNFGSFLYSQKRYSEAYDAFVTAASDLEYDSRPVALANQGRAALKLGRRNRAISAFEHALSLDPGFPMALIELAELAFEDQDYAQAKRYLDGFNSAMSKPTARSLWLGIRIERVFGNKDKEASYRLALKNLYPYSKEWLQYRTESRAVH